MIESLGLFSSISLDHFLHDVSKTFLWFPTQDLFGFRIIAAQVVYFCLALESRILGIDIPEIDTSGSALCLKPFFDGMYFIRSKNVVIGRFLLQHPPSAFHVIGGVTPIPRSVEIAKRYLFSCFLEFRNAFCNLSSDKLFPAPGGLMVKHNSAGCVDFRLL